MATKKAGAKTTKKRTKKTKTKAARGFGQGLAMINKALKGKSDAVVEIDSNARTKSMPHLPTSSAIIDYLIGGRPNAFGIPPCPGLPRGKIVNMYGHEGCGKTTLALQMCAEVCRNGGRAVYVDWENEVALDYAAALGVPIEDKDHFLLLQPDTLEEGFKYILVFVADGVELVVIDSVGAAVPQAIFEQKIEEVGDLGRLGLMAAKWSSFLPKVKRMCARSGSTIVGISQLRAKINTGGHGGKTTTEQGGFAWRFYSALRISLARVAQEKGKVYDAITNAMIDQTVGAKIKITLDKCKVGLSQGQFATFYLQHGRGIDDLRSVLEVAAKRKIVVKGGAWYAWNRKDGTEVRGQGIEAFKRKIREIDGAEQELYDLVLPVMMTYDPLAVIEVEEEESDLAEGLSELDIEEVMNEVGEAGEEHKPTVEEKEAEEEANNVG